VVHDYNASFSAIEDAGRCTTLTCLRSREPAIEAALSNYTADLVALDAVPTLNTQVAAVDGDLSQLSTVFTGLTNSANQQEFESRLQTSQLDTLLLTFHSDTNMLLTAVNANGF
jgi:hypothetical protein